MNRDENHLKWRVSRRRLVKLMGTAGAAAIVIPLVPAFLGKAR